MILLIVATIVHYFHSGREPIKYTEPHLSHVGAKPLPGGGIAGYLAVRANDSHGGEGLARSLSGAELGSWLTAISGAQSP